MTAKEARELATIHNTRKSNVMEMISEKVEQGEFEMFVDDMPDYLHNFLRANGYIVSIYKNCETTVKTYLISW